MASLNSRKYYRVSRNLVVSFRRQGSGEPYVMTQTQDVSKSGMAIVSDIPFKPGEKLHLIIMFPFRLQERVNMAGEVVSAVKIETLKEEYRIGIQFIDFDKELANELGFFIQKCRLQDKG